MIPTARHIAPIDRSRSTRRAFSLVELVTVMAIGSILASMAIPRWSTATQHYQADLAAQRVASDLTLARARASFASATVTVTFNPANSTYSFTGMPDPDHANATYAVNLAGPPYRAAITSVNFGGTSQLSFDGFGTPMQGGAIVVTVGDRSHTITVDPVTGNATIQ